MQKADSRWAVRGLSGIGMALRLIVRIQPDWGGVVDGALVQGPHAMPPRLPRRREPDDEACAPEGPRLAALAHSRPVIRNQEQSQRIAAHSYRLSGSSKSDRGAQGGLAANP